MASWRPHRSRLLPEPVASPALAFIALADVTIMLSAQRPNTRTSHTFFAAAGFGPPQTFASYEARAPGRLGSRRMLVAAQAKEEQALRHDEAAPNARARHGREHRERGVPQRVRGIAPARCDPSGPSRRSSAAPSASRHRCQPPALIVRPAAQSGGTLSCIRNRRSSAGRYLFIAAVTCSTAASTVAAPRARVTASTNVRM